MNKNNLYETDFYSWAMEQLAALKQGNFTMVDIDNLIEEVEEMGNNRRDALKSQYIRLLQHLLKWQYQPDQRSSSWERSIINSRVEIDKILDGNPGLKPKRNVLYDDAYRYALRLATRETKLPAEIFPTTNPWAITVVVDDNFFPEEFKT